jgi:nucleotide-binding universal stress UspA family protein
MNILVAADGSPYTIKAVKYLIAHLDIFQGDRNLHLLHVKQAIPFAHARAVVGKQALEDYYRAESKAALAPAENLLRESGIAFESNYRVGEIADEIQAYANNNKIDLIVMGSHGHGALQNLVMGSVATKVLAGTTIPVLIVR